MEKTIGIYDLTDCSKLGFKERISIYKNVGFRELALYLDNQYCKENENYLDIINYAKNSGLIVKQVHLDYKISNMICDENSSLYFDYLDAKATECEKLDIKNVVVHASKGDNPPYISEGQLSKLVTIARKHKNVNFCFENVRNNNNLKQILALNESNIKMCYDLGHAHAYDNELSLLNEFKNKIGCSHLHNNFGKDDHLLLNDGEIDYKPILKVLTSLNDVSNCIEAFPERNCCLSKEEFMTFVKKCYDSAKID